MYRNFEKYEIFEDGMVWSYKTNRFLKPRKNKHTGYMQVALSDNNNKIHFETVHKITYFAINGLWDYPTGYEINHKDENKENNHISNLELVTAKQNINHGTRTERSSKSRSKRVAAYNENGELVMVFPSTAEAGRNGYYHGNVSRCCNGKMKSYRGYTWKYLN